MIDPLGSLSRTIALLRSQMAPQQAAGTAGLRSGAAARPLSSAAAAAGVPSQLALLPARLSAIPADDPQRARRALKLFVEAVLVDEFGDPLLQDASGAELVERTLNALEGDDALRTTLAAASLELLG